MAQDIQRKSPEELEKDLQEIYSDYEGQMPDFSRLDGKPHNRVLAFLLWAGFFIIALAGVSWAGFFFFLRPSSFTGDRATVTIGAPDTLTAGAETAITLTYRNDEKIPLASAVLSAELPKEFVELSSDPPRDQGGQWPVGSVAPGTGGRVTIKGWARKEPGATLTFLATLTYKPADFNAQFQKVATRTIAVSDAVLTISGTGTDQVLPGDDVAYDYTIENASDRAQENLQFRTDSLDGFIFESSTPAPTAESNSVWKLPNLDPHKTATVSIRGMFSAAARGPKTLRGSVGFIDDGAFTPIASASTTSDVQKSDIAVSLIVNGSNQPPAVSFGDTLYFSLNWKNAGDVHLRNVTLSAELPSQPTGAELLDWVSLKESLGGARKGSTITWNSKQIIDLADIQPGAEGTINFSVPIVSHVSTLTASGTSTLYAISASVRGMVGKTGRVDARDVVSDPILIQLNSDTVFKAYGRFYDESGVPLGSGPLPPKAGEKTVYRVFWVIANTLHELSNLTISTVLPENAKWTGAPRQVDAGDLTFDDTGRQATWHLNKLPTSVKQVTVSFDVELSPTLQDVGNILNLTGENRFESLDKATNAVILKTERPVATDLLGDQTAAGKGIVIE